jgi:hypothetical protein
MMAEYAPAGLSGGRGVLEPAGVIEPASGEPTKEARV